MNKIFLLDLPTFIARSIVIVINVFSVVSIIFGAYLQVHHETEENWSRAPRNLVRSLLYLHSSGP